MTEKLLESDFLTLDISSVFNSGTVKTNAETADAQPEQKARPEDWGIELKNRLTANKNMSVESRKNEYDIELQFFNEFFTAMYGPALAKNLLDIGDQLRKDIKILGFETKTNPILAFLSLSYVQNYIIRPKLLNIYTYKAIHNAVAKSLVADSEFFRASDYNILYCLDLYKKKVSEIEQYLMLQQKVLSPTASKYSQKDQDNNKRVFLVLAEVTKEVDQNKKLNIQKNIEATKLPSVKSVEAKLNSLEFAEQISGSSASNDSNEENQETSNLDFDAILDLTKSPERALAAIQYLSIYSGSDTIKSYLSSKKFSNITMIELNKAIKEVSKLFAGKKYSKLDAERLAKQLVG